MHSQKPWTIAQAKKISQGDFLGKRAAFSQLRGIPTGKLVNWQWWLFISNLGNQTEDVIGPGIVEANLIDNSNTAVILDFRRINDTTVTLQLTESLRVSYRIIETFENL